MEEKLTITEGLADLKTLAKKIAKKREFISGYLARAEGSRDPLEKDGGSIEVIKRERQAIGDLEQRSIDIRRAITEANLATTITVGGVTRSIYDWLTWRRELSESGKSFANRMLATIQELRRQANQKGVKLVEGRGENLSDIVVNVSESEVGEEVEQFEDILGTLDGLLSLKNATVLIDV